MRAENRQASKSTEYPYEVPSPSPPTTPTSCNMATCHSWNRGAGGSSADGCGRSCSPTKLEIYFKDLIYIKV